MFITQQSHKDLCDVVWPDKPKNEGQRLFVKTDFLTDYVIASVEFPPHILVTGLSDYSPRTFMSDQTIHAFLERPNIIAWYAQNVCTKHPKLIHLPIGLEDTPAKLEFCAKHGDELRATPKRNDVYTNFNPETNPDERTCFVSSVGEKVSFEQYMRTMATYKYVLCPMGNGIDTHRFWEAQVCGCIPIVRCPKEFLPTYADVPYISLPGVCHARFGHPCIVHRLESVFDQNSPAVPIVPLVQYNPLARGDHFV
jgi:hypothetical protein